MNADNNPTDIDQEIGWPLYVLAVLASFVASMFYPGPWFGG
jgi:hypothetical protein